MNNEILITAAKPEDAEGIAHVLYQTWLATYPNEEHGISKDDILDKLKDLHSPGQIEKRRERIRENNPLRKNFVAKDNTTIVGSCSLFDEEDAYHLRTIYVLPEYQGKGVGQKLWAECLKTVIDTKKKIIVEVAVYNQQAINFYKKLGFQETGKAINDEHLRMKSGSIIVSMELELRMA